MGLFDFFSSGSKLPSYKQLYDEERFDFVSEVKFIEFSDSLFRILRGRNIALKVMAVGQVELTPKGGRAYLINIDNLIRDWDSLDSKDQDEKIHSFLDSLFNDAHYYVGKDQILEHLCIRVYTDIDFSPDNFFIKEEIPGLHFILAIDEPQKYMSLGKDEVEEWGVNEAELWAQAYKNLLNSEELKILKLNEDVNTVFAMLHYSSAVPLSYYQIINDDLFKGKWGSIIIPLGVSQCLSVRVDDKQVNEVINGMTQLISKQFQSEDRPINTCLYWLRNDNTWKIIPPVIGLNKEIYYEFDEGILSLG
jgi:hypothetical protein